MLKPARAVAQEAFRHGKAAPNAFPANATRLFIHSDMTMNVAMPLMHTEPACQHEVR